MFGLSRVWPWLTQPPASIERPELLRQVHLLLSILAALSAVWIVAIASILVRAGLHGIETAGAELSTTSSLMYLCGGAATFFSYLLARRGHPMVASRILVSVALALAFLQILITGDIRVVDYPINAIVLCSLLLTPADMGVTFALTVAFYLLLPSLIHAGTLLQMVNILIVTFFIGAVSFLATLFHRRNLKQLENQAAQMAKDAKRGEETRNMETVARMATGVAHEFNNVLMAISAYAEIMELRAQGNAVDDAKGILEASRRGSQVTEKILSLSQQQFLKPKAVDVAELLHGRERDLVSFFGPGRRLSLRSSAEPIVLLIDPDLFYEALRTLVRKAGENGPVHGTITIGWKLEALPQNDDSYLPAGNYCAITISNSGPEAQEPLKSRIPEPLSGDAEVHTEDISLAAAYGIVRQIGGQIETRIDSGVSTIFVVTVPTMDMPD